MKKDRKYRIFRKAESGEKAMVQIAIGTASRWQVKDWQTYGYAVVETI